MTNPFRKRKFISKINNKSQVKIQEMTFMILFLVVFFILVFLFYLIVSMSGLKKSVEETTREGNILLVERLAGSPEFGCGGSEGLCVDTDKVIALIEASKNYKSFWKVEGLVIERIYPYENKTLECTIGSYPKCNTFTIKKPGANVIPDFSYVALCRKDYANGYLYNKCELGKIKVYSKKLS